MNNFNSLSIFNKKIPQYIDSKETVYTWDIASYMWCRYISMMQSYIIYYLNNLGGLYQTGAYNSTGRTYPLVRHTWGFTEVPKYFWCYLSVQHQTPVLQLGLWWGFEEGVESRALISTMHTVKKFFWQCKLSWISKHLCIAGR